MAVSISELPGQKDDTIVIDPLKTTAPSPITTDPVPDSVSAYNIHMYNNSIHYPSMYRYQVMIMEIIQMTLILCYRGCFTCTAMYIMVHIYALISYR